MAKRSDEIVPVTPEQARLMCDEKAKERGEKYTQEDVYLDFIARGGEVTLGTLVQWLRMKRKGPAAVQLAILHAVINDRCEQEGFGRPLADILYLLPSPVGEPGDGATPDGSDGIIYLRVARSEQDFRDLRAANQ